MSLDRMRVFYLALVSLFFLPLYSWAATKDEAVTHYVYLGKNYTSPPPLSLLEKILSDEGLQGARFSDRDNNRTGRMFGHKFELHEFMLPQDEDPLTVADEILKQGYKLIITDLNADDVLSISRLPAAKDAILLNIRADDDQLRVSACHENIFHMIPSRAMRADALAQYLVWKKWRKWFLVTGKHSSDKLFAEAIKRAAKRFGGKIVEQRSYKLETGNRRVETGHQQIQTQMPMLTRGAADHDVVFVADESESFGLYLPYRTTEPRPVVGTYGLVATAWHRSFEQYGGARLQNDYEEFSDRVMTERDYLGWLATKLLGEAVLRGTDKSITGIRNYILADDLKLAGYKGRPMNFRSWNQQLRQPLLLSGARSLVSMAPLDGFLHPTHYTDTLGFDKADSKCRLSES